MESARPLIGVTGPRRGGWPAWIFTRFAVYRAGGRALRITSASKPELARLRGLVIGGGADVSDPLNGDPPYQPPPPSRVRWPRKLLDVLFAPLVLLVRLIASTKRHGFDPSRDAMELALLEHARARELPVLGICRGSQLMNLAEGGTLVRDVDTLYDERPQLYTVLPRREVRVREGSALHRIVGRSELLVNSLHFHAVREPGRGFAIVASEPSGVPQAIEHTSRRFYIGVQWHPEYLPQHATHQELFRALCEAAQAASPGVDAAPQPASGLRQQH
ncbi:MAG TPA: gamma-glutamyl-gamma-aminobutyrate hydrolase family protein [Polyangiales bacterium]|nr:gamma-glutamyl-gamma-aminobutyrate hydrolase family protein [Polyangiales bacterium]